MGDDATDPDELDKPHPYLKLVPDAPEDEQLPALGDNGGPPLDALAILPPSDKRPSAAEAQIVAHIDGITAVARVHAGTKPWGARLDQAALYPIAVAIETAIEVAKRQKPRGETALDKKLRLTLKQLRAILKQKHDGRVNDALAMREPEIAADARAVFDMQMSLMPVFDNAPRISMFPFIAREVLRAVDAMNAREVLYAVDVDDDIDEITEREPVPPIPDSWGASGVVVAVLNEALRQAGLHLSDEAVRSALANDFRDK